MWHRYKTLLSKRIKVLTLYCFTGGVIICIHREKKCEQCHTTLQLITQLFNQHAHIQTSKESLSQSDKMAMC